MAELHPGRKALAHYRRILEQKPTKDDHELSLMMPCLTAFREDLMRANRHDQALDHDRERLYRCNAIIAVVMAMHFPLGNPPWGEFEKARAWLEALVDEIDSPADGERAAAAH